jgi:hypothetical protein
MIAMAVVAALVFTLCAPADHSLASEGAEAATGGAVQPAEGDAGAADETATGETTDSAVTDGAATEDAPVSTDAAVTATDAGVEAADAGTSGAGGRTRGGISPFADADWYYNHANDTTYTLTNRTELRELAELVNTAGINFSGKTITLNIPGNNISGLSIPPIGTEISPFAGTFDGGGVTIGNLSISVPSSMTCIGLFGYTTATSVIRNVNLSGGTLRVAESSASGRQIRYVGGIAGYAGGDIENCSSSLDIEVSSNLAIGKNYGIIRNVGGIAGYIGGDMKDCEHSGDISISSPSNISDDIRFLVGEVGGIAGAQGNVEKPDELPVMERCVNHEEAEFKFNLTGMGGIDRFGQQLYAVSFAVGGVVGQASGIVSNCTNSAVVNTSNVLPNGKPEAGRGANRTGGIVGDLRGNTLENVNKSTVGNVSEKDPGFNYFVTNGGVSAAPASYPSTAAIYDCVNTGEVVGLAMVGGIVGNTGTFVEIEGCSNVADVKGCRWNKPFTAGIAGATQGDMRYCYNTGDIYSITGGGYYCAGIAGGFWSLNDSLTPDNEVVPVNEMTGCYTVGRIYTDAAGFRTGLLAGENDSYIHDNVYSMSSPDSEVVDSDFGTTTNNTWLSPAELRASKGRGMLNVHAAGKGGWRTFYLPDTSGSNNGYPVVSHATDSAGYPLPNASGSDISGLTATVIGDAVYSTTMDPVPAVEIAGLVQNADFYVMPAPNTKNAAPGATAYSAVVGGMGLYKGGLPSVSYHITKAAISGCTIVADSSYFNWEVQKPTRVRVVDASGAYVDPAEYTWETLYDASKGTAGVLIGDDYHYYDYTNSHDGNYKYDIKVTATTSSIYYAGSTVQPAFRILPKSLARMGEDDQADQAVSYGAVMWGGREWDFAAALDDTSGNYVRITYTGRPITPTVKSVKYLGRELRPMVPEWFYSPYDYHYRYVYGNPNPEELNDASTDPVDVTPPGKPACMTVRYLSSVCNFRNYINVFFTIVPADMAGVVAAPVARQSYTGDGLTPGVSLTYNGITLREGADYTLEYRNNTSAGPAEIVATGRGNYAGTKVIPFNIAAASIDGAGAASVKAQVYTGKALKPDVKLTWRGAVLRKGSDYTLTYKDNVAPGRAEVRVAGAGSFAGSKTLYFNVNPAKGKITKLKPGRRSLKVTFKKPAAAQKATALQLRYRVKGKSKWKTVNVSAKKSVYTIKKLQKGKRYQLQLRIVRTIKSGKAKGRYSGAWSAVKTSKAVK